MTCIDYIVHGGQAVTLSYAQLISSSLISCYEAPIVALLKVEVQDVALKFIETKTIHLHACMHEDTVVAKVL